HPHHRAAGKPGELLCLLLPVRAARAAEDERPAPGAASVGPGPAARSYHVLAPRQALLSARGPRLRHRERRGRLHGAARGPAGVAPVVRAGEDQRARRRAGAGHGTPGRQCRRGDPVAPPVSFATVSPPKRTLAAACPTHRLLVFPTWTPPARHAWLTCPARRSRPAPLSPPAGYCCRLPRWPRCGK